MAKRTLDQTYIHKGKFYGPGVVEVPSDLAKHLDAQQALANEPEPVQQAVEPQPAAPVLAEPEAPAVPRRATKPKPGEK